MKTQKMLLIAALVLLLAMFLTSCVHEEDPGPLQSDERNYTLLDFDRLEMGDALVISVQQGAVYSIRARGDRRNLDDLNVEKAGSTLRINFKNSGNRDHTTYIDITMPVLAAVNFSGATSSAITGFRGAEQFEIIVSGASVCQLSMESLRASINLSGASKLTASGKFISVKATASGASDLSMFNVEAEDAEVEASGASKIRVSASKTLKAVANGASAVFYRGAAAVTSSVSGASTVQAD